MFLDHPASTAPNGDLEPEAPDALERGYFTRARASKVGDGADNVEHVC
jgi:hypothetical protein